LRSSEVNLEEKNLRLRCEIATLRDLNRAQTHADENGFIPVEPEQLEIIEKGNNL